MKHAYLIEVNKNFKILNLLIDLLDDEDNDFFILIDKKCGVRFSDVINYVPKKSKIFELPQIEISWASFSGICAAFDLLKFAYNKRVYRYYHFMQGSDFVIKTNKEIKNFFEKNNGKEFIDFNPDWYKLGEYKFLYHHFFVDNRFYRTSKILKLVSHSIAKLEKIFDHRIGDEKIYSGSAMWSITNEYVKILLENENMIKKRCKNTLAADEVIWQTYIMNTVYKDNIYRFEDAGSNLYYIDLSHMEGSSPYTFLSGDFDKLMNLPENYLYARKFNEDRDYIIVKKIYDYLCEKDEQINTKK